MIQLPSRRAIHMWQRNRDVFVRLWWSLAPAFMIEPVLLLLAIGLGFGAYIGVIQGEEYINYIVPGILASHAMTTATFEATYGAYFRMEYRRTYDAILATPLNIEDIVTGEILWGATRSVITATIIMIVALLFGLLNSWWAILIPVVAGLVGFLFSCLAIIFVSVASSVYSFNYYFTLFIAPMTFFSGAFFPLDNLPAAVGRISPFLPLTHSVRLMRALVTGEFGVSTFASFAIVVAAIIVLFLMAAAVMRRRVLE
ncbi:lipooligosaccharide transport system permease protein [Dehalogenimonas formicexedens]|uniref:Transport permease protein n=1 Tax=Dehalogenimonas formicexedens TaxID=1839801 RepID=A0A1P8F917_9CHLR|nr:ABC transporter permease [Dehalogenimonas formicexedens]APV44956.1 lipooligosaccharide transport system permease protein [Dehalogenimonas formicexedens]